MIKLVLGPEIISSYKRLSYTVWHALAEFVDNSTQAYFNNKTILDERYKIENSVLTVEVSYGKDKKGNFLRIKDNSIGMSHKELKTAVIVGKPPQNNSGRSKYGLGLKTGACWFGDWWTVKTKKLNEDFEHQITVDVEGIAKGNLNLKHRKTKSDKQNHYTIIEIRKLHRKFANKTTAKVKDYLRSIYRIDISTKKLKLVWSNHELRWNYDELYKRLLIGMDQNPVKREFEFTIGKKKVTGWAGVLEKGSRKSAGFSIIQSDRVIKGWPESYRPETIYGPQIGGSNDLVNQRLVGEIVLEGFEISHTKDEILFDDGEQEKLEYKLANLLADIRQTALSYRKYDNDERLSDFEKEKDAAVTQFNAELNSNEVKDFIRTYEVPSSEYTTKINSALKESIVNRFPPTINATIDNLVISVYLVKDMSPNDPYLIIESTKNKDSVTVIINVTHPYWNELTNQQSIVNFIRHCVYDGVSEWKAYFKTKKIEPDTIKQIKDNLLRIPLNLNID